MLCTFLETDIGTLPEKYFVRIEQSSVHISRRLLQDVRDTIHDEKQ